MGLHTHSLIGPLRASVLPGSVVMAARFEASAGATEVVPEFLVTTSVKMTGARNTEGATDIGLRDLGCEREN